MSVVAVFVGMPGSGKTTAGRIMARSLNVPFRDSDALIEETAGRTIPEIFSADGEPGFRTIEAQVIQDALENFHGVLSLGGERCSRSPRARHSRSIRLCSSTWRRKSWSAV